MIQKLSSLSLQWNDLSRLECVCCTECFGKTTKGLIYHQG